MNDSQGNHIKKQQLFFSFLDIYRMPTDLFPPLNRFYLWRLTETWSL